MEISFFGPHLLETHVGPTAQVVTTSIRLDILSYKKEIEMKNKTRFGYFDQKQKCNIFTFVQYIIFNSFLCIMSVIFRQPVQLSMLSCSLFH